MRQITISVEKGEIVYREYHLSSSASSCQCGCGMVETSWEAYCPLIDHPSFDAESMDAVTQKIDTFYSEKEHASV